MGIPANYLMVDTLFNGFRLVERLNARLMLFSLMLLSDDSASF